MMPPWLWLWPGRRPAHTQVGPAADQLLARDRTQLVVSAYEIALVTPSGPRGLSSSPREAGR